MSESPTIAVIAGPNGAGKSTIAARVLPAALSIHEFVNADVIARGLSAFGPESVALPAGRIMLARLQELAEARVSFAFETTLASRTFAPWIKELITGGFKFHLVFVWLPSPEIAIARVADRVRLGGHHVPDETVRRRYLSGLKNFFELYQPMAETWQMINNRDVSGPSIIAEGNRLATVNIADEAVWKTILETNRGL